MIFILGQVEKRIYISSLKIESLPISFNITILDWNKEFFRDESLKSQQPVEVNLVFFNLSQQLGLRAQKLTMAPLMSSFKYAIIQVYYSDCSISTLVLLVSSYELE